MFLQADPAGPADLRRAAVPVSNGTDCQKGFYGVRFYRDRTGQYQVGVCIQRMDLCLPLDEFLTSSQLTEIRDLREAEYHQLTNREAGRRRH